MNRSSMKEEEEEVAERTTTTTTTATNFYLWQYPCYFLQEALSAFLRCLGVESTTGRTSRKGSMKKEEKTPLLKHASEHHADLDHSQITASNTYQEAADPPSTTSTQININNASAMERRGPRKPPLNQGSGPQHN